MRIITLFLLTVLFPFTYCFAQDDDDAVNECSAILNPALKDYTQVTSSSDYRSLAAQLLSSDKFQNGSTGGSVDATIPIANILTQDGIKYNNAQEMKDHFLNNNQQNLSDDRAVNIIYSFLAPDVAARWQECMSEHFAAKAGKMIVGTMKANDDTITISVRYAMNLGTDTLPTINGTVLLGATRSGYDPFDKGSLLKNEATLTCVRDGKRAVTFVINTSRGSCVLRLPKVEEARQQQQQERPAPPCPRGGDLAGLEDIKNKWKQDMLSHNVSEDVANMNIACLDYRVKVRWTYEHLLWQIDNNQTVPPSPITPQQQMTNFQNDATAQAAFHDDLYRFYTSPPSQSPNPSPPPNFNH